MITIKGKDCVNLCEEPHGRYYIRLDGLTVYPPKTLGSI